MFAMVSSVDSAWVEAIELSAVSLLNPLLGRSREKCPELVGCTSSLLSKVGLSHRHLWRIEW